MKKKPSRRSFLRTSFRAAAGLGCLAALGTQQQCRTSSSVGQRRPSAARAFATLRIDGDHYAIGFAMGFHFGNEIRQVLRARQVWFQRLQAHVTGTGAAYFAELRRQAERHFPQLMEELRGMADGAHLPLDDLFLLNVKAEIGARLFGAEVKDPGCSSVYLVRDGERTLLHNEDGHRVFADNMFLLQATPPSGVSFTVLVYPGTLPGNGPGINTRGIIQTTNFIAARDSHVGVPRYFLNRAVLEAESLDDAIDRATFTPRAFAYHHNLASVPENRLISLEVTPERHSIVEPLETYCHTNHLIHEATTGYAQDEVYVRASSLTRYEVIQAAIQRHGGPDPLDKKQVLDILSSHRQAPHSPCRHPDGDVTGQTLATAVFPVADGTMHLYKGNPCTAVPAGHLTIYRRPVH
ncbi:MAG: hypothetical protein JXQ27_12160 [Acidobacteria bacterium]|nr:hypothetical protein [Acidobacteriota bacterium]